jgi:hypothetical protein
MPTLPRNFPLLTRTRFPTLGRWADKSSANRCHCSRLMLVRESSIMCYLLFVVLPGKPGRAAGIGYILTYSINDYIIPVNTLQAALTKL